MTNLEAQAAGWREAIERPRKWAEFLLLFIGVPLALAFAVHPGHFRYALFTLGGVGVTLLLLTPGFRWRTLIEGPVLRHWRLILFFIIGAAAVISAGVFIMEAQGGPSGRFLSMPFTRPQLMMFIAIAYPIAMVIPQELLFRSLFFERYGELMPNKWVAIFVNSVLFGLAHLFYWNVPAVALTFLANIFFAYAYVHLRSWPLAWLLHSVGGVMVFAIGLGPYFFHGNIGGL